jgi:hypothetical protein
MKKTAFELAELLQNTITHFMDGMTTFDEMVMRLQEGLNSKEVQDMVKESLKATDQE